MYGTHAGVPGDEKGFIIDMTPCEFFDTPVRITGKGSHSSTFQLNLSRL